MKRTIRGFGIIAVVAIAGFTFVACGTEHNVSVSGTPRVGHTLTATSEATGGSFEGNFSWQMSGPDGPFNWGNPLTNWGNITGGSRQNLELRTATVGRYIRASRRTSGGDTIFSNPIGPIQAP